MNSKKILAAVLAVMMTAGAAAVLPAGESFKGFKTAYAMPVQESADFEYTENNGEITITSYKGTSSNVEIPSTIDGKTVTAIGKDAFKENTTIKSVSLPGTIKEIGMSAFEKSSLESIEVPGSVETLPFMCFNECHQLKNVKLNEGLKMIDGMAFYYCESLEELVLPNSVTSIGDGRLETGGNFGNCFKLKKITIPETVTVMSIGAFENCYALEEINIPDSIKKIDQLTFHNCTGLKEVDIPENVKVISLGAFEGCKGLEKVTIPDGVKSIGDAAFQSCDNLKDVTIPDSVTNIGTKAFGIIVEEVCDPETGKYIETLYHKVEDLTIHCSEGSDAEKFCKENGIKSEPIVGSDDSSSAADSTPESSSDADTPDSSSTADSTPDSSSTADSTPDSKPDSSSTTESKPDSKPDSKQDEKIMLGDVNGDKKIDIEDAVQVIGHVNGVKALTADEAKRANVDGNSKVDIEDAVTIIGHVNGIKAIGS